MLLEQLHVIQDMNIMDHIVGNKIFVESIMIMEYAGPAKLVITWMLMETVSNARLIILH